MGLVKLYEEFSGSAFILNSPLAFGKRQRHPNAGTGLPLIRVISVMLVFWADTSPSHQNGTSGPPGAVVKCHLDPLTEWCQLCVRLHLQTLKHLSVILLSLPTVMTVGNSYPFWKNVQEKMVIKVQTASGDEFVWIGIRTFMWCFEQLLKIFVDHHILPW